MPDLPRPLLLVLVLAGAPAQALDLAFPGPAQQTSVASENGAAYALPVGPWDGETFLSRRVEGTITRRAFRIDGPQSTVSLMAFLRTQVEKDGWRILYECDAPVCGGFDFRFATVILPEPDMHVDLGDFRVLSADRGVEVLNLIVSRSPRAGFVQITQAAPGPAAEPRADPASPAGRLPEMLPPPEPVDPVPGAVAAPGAPTPDAAIGDVVARLEAEGHAALPGLRFASGASTLEPGDYSVLEALAAWLRADPSRRVAIVGHTDASGGLEANVVLSRRRADAVREALLSGHGIPAAQVEAEGVGYLAPIAPNTTPAGREINRRVEAVVLVPGG